MGSGGNLQNSVGEWKLGFVVGLQGGNSLWAELLAAVEGLELCWKEWCKRAICEFNYLDVIKTAQSVEREAHLRHKYDDILLGGWLINVFGLGR
uniref:RNase H type-1 domain-containing protein n=1 Tax=Cajanus cajan TaxID=3821 RepID=A0A151RL72_CAJCA|nr:hypothetical protein KK1_035267 [Cajanus cajan]